MSGAGKNQRLACVFLASGHSRRFGGNKLLSDFGGKPMIDVVLERFPSELFHRTVVVTRYAAVAVTAAALGLSVVENDDETGDIAHTIRLGLSVLGGQFDGCMFAVCDQPLLRAESVAALVAAWRERPAGIAALGVRGVRGNPVIFPRALFGELAALAPHESGSRVIEAHANLLTVLDVEDARELHDIDRRGDLENLL